MKKNGFISQTEETLALRSFTKLIRAAETVSAEVHAGLNEHGLTISQFGVLEALFHLGPLCQRDIAAKILKSTGNITMVIDNLEKRSLVGRVRKAKDRRYCDIHLTEDGRNLIAAIFPAHARRIVMAMARLSTAEQEDLGCLCRRFTKQAPLPATEEELS